MEGGASGWLWAFSQRRVGIARLIDSEIDATIVDADSRPIGRVARQAVIDVLVEGNG